MKEIDRLVQQLFPVENDGSRVLDLKFFPGEQPVTEEEFCKEVHSAFVQIDSHQSVRAASYAEQLTPVAVDVFVTA